MSEKEITTFFNLDPFYDILLELQITRSRNKVLQFDLGIMDANRMLIFSKMNTDCKFQILKCGYVMVLFTLVQLNFTNFM